VLVETLRMSYRGHESEVEDIKVREPIEAMGVSVVNVRVPVAAV
jgi:hypothetical protein